VVRDSLTFRDLRQADIRRAILADAPGGCDDLKVAASRFLQVEEVRPALGRAVEVRWRGLPCRPTVSRHCWSVKKMITF
jgi:hypothetical protein